MKFPILPEFTAEEYLRWEEARAEKYELHNGFIVGFAGGTLGHDRIAYAVRTAFERAFAPCVTFGSDVKIQVSLNSYFYPDVTVVCDDVDLWATAVTSPTVVAEVLSPSTQGYDRIYKRGAYRALPSLEAFLIVHVEMRRIEVDARDDSGVWKTHPYDGGDTALVHGKTFAVDDIYRDTPAV